MTDMYDKDKHFEGGTLKPYPHEELGVEVSICEGRVRTRQFGLT